MCKRRFGFTIAAGLICVTAIGCSKSGDKTPAASTAQKEGDAHGEWWCSEHGMPEEICVQCDSKLADQFKSKGDWCKLHDLPDSQCLVCHPDLEAKFALQYEAKYGSKPPKPTELPGKKHEHDEHEHEHKEKEAK